MSVFYLGALLDVGQFLLRCEGVSVIVGQVLARVMAWSRSIQEQSREKGNAGVQQGTVCLQWDRALPRSWGHSTAAPSASLNRGFVPVEVA